MVITKLDKEHADFGAALESAQNTFQQSNHSFYVADRKRERLSWCGGRGPHESLRAWRRRSGERDRHSFEGRDIVDKTRERLVELVAESNDQLMEKYFEQGTLDEEDILPNINNAIAQSKLCPVFAVSSITQVGCVLLLNGLVDFAPDPAHHEAEWGKPVDAGPDAERIGRKYSDSEPFSAYCFRTVADPLPVASTFSRSSAVIFRLTLTHSTPLADSAERLGALHVMQGKTTRQGYRSSRRRHHRLRETERDTNRRHALRQAGADCLRPGRVSRSRDRFCYRAEVAPGRREDQRGAAQDSRRRSGASLQSRCTNQRVSAVWFGTVARRDSRGEVEEALRRGSHTSSAEGSVQRDDHAARRSSGPAQETDRWPRAVWRLQVRV